MSRLMRAPEECGSWEWALGGAAPPGLASGLDVAARMAAVLRGRGLLEPEQVEWFWFVYDVGDIGIRTVLPVRGRLDSADLGRRVEASRPSGYPDARVGNLSVLGRGVWIDAEGEERREEGLVVLSVDPDERELSADVAVFHDVWGYFDFRGVPHPEVHRRNAPRLAAALGELDALLGAKAEEGEMTYFGRAEGYGIALPDVIDGRGPDLTDRL
ncbi:hypothetical protein [Streptomyces sp. SID11385]|uniref:hypothetical protein n=1 Tax=Streptomyces sp. SID11385 TaxID=2706031 RepID=UPI001EF1CE80|nr:hypothetical protein [Streptomyces sp. SID11385]